jgi:hypothetical protein
MFHPDLDARPHAKGRNIVLVILRPQMDIRYSYRMEDFEEIVEVADNLAPRRRAVRFAKGP